MPCASFGASIIYYYYTSIIDFIPVSSLEYPALILEFCELGSLSLYLHARRPPMGCSINSLTSFSEGDHDVPSKEDSTLSSEENAGALAYVTREDLTNFSFQTCRGLQYLASRSIIHRDIAARNVLITKDKIAKVSDFGMARNRGTNAVYVMSNQVSSYQESPGVVYLIYLQTCSQIIPF